MFIITPVTIVSLPGRVIIIFGHRIGFLVNYRSGSILLLINYRRWGRRCVINPWCRYSETDMGADIYLSLCGAG
jgi:hypothetical protein